MVQILEKINFDSDGILFYFIYKVFLWGPEYNSDVYCILTDYTKNYKMFKKIIFDLAGISTLISYNIY